MSKNRTHVGFVLTGFLLLLLGAFLDSARGPILPILVSQFDMTLGEASWFLIVGNLFAIPVLFVLFPVLNRVGERSPALFGCFLGAVGILLAHAADSYVLLILCGLFLGVTVAIVGLLCNIYVILGAPEMKRAQYLCGLHFMFALGSVLAPLSVRYLIGEQIYWAWSLSLGLVFLIPAVLSLLRLSNSPKPESLAPQSAKLNTTQTKILIGFAGYVGAEVVTSMWMVAYLVNYHSMSVPRAALFLGGFFFVMALTRALCFFSLKETFVDRLSWGCLILAMFFFGLGHLGAVWAFPLVGVMGPYFPLHLAQVNRSFPSQWRSMTVWVIVCIQVVLVICHLVVGRLSDHVGLRVTYLFPFVLLLFALYGLYSYFQKKHELT